ncbi:MAG: DUF2066 domain-containing protein [Alphaproteobacteria bacterium]|nr:DUF2066 domain-containing protein [Alphaproteobacteria bacterium]
MRHLWLIMVFCLGFFARPVTAADLYAVEVLADVTDVNASVAREKAMAEANRQAFELVLKKITTPKHVAQVMTLNDNQILNFIKEVSVLSEKSSNVRYIAELRVKLNEDVVKRYMSEKQIPFMVDKAANVLVIPVYRKAAALSAELWEEDNLWRKSWEKNTASEGMAEFVIPEATDQNMEIIDAEKALSLDTRLLGWLARQSRASDVFVLEAVAADGMDVRIYSPEGGLQETVHVDGAADETLFDEAVRRVKSRIAARIKSQNIAEAQKQTEITVLFMYQKIREWLDLQKQLSDIPYVKKVQEEAIGDGKTQFKLVFSGSIARLNQALAQKLFVLNNHGDFYVIESRY